MNWQIQVRRLFNLQPGEGPVVARLLLFFFLMGLSFVAIKTAGYALFIAEFGTANIPYTYLAIAVGVPALTFASLRLSVRLTFSRFTVMTVGVLLVLTVLLRLGMETPAARIVIFLLPAWDMAVTNLGAGAFWSVAGVLFDLRQSKRLSGLVNSGRWLAATIGGALIPIIVGQIGTPNLLVVAAVSLTLTLIMLLRIFVVYRKPFTSLDAPSQPSPRVESRQPIRRPLWRNSYLLLIFAVIFLSVGAEFFVNQIYYDQAAINYPDLDELAAFTATISAFFGVATFFMSVFFNGRILNQFGVRPGLLFQPVIMIVLLGGVAVIGALGGPTVISFGLAVGSQILTVILSYGLYSSTERVLYQPLPPDQRSRGTVVSNGIVEPIAVGFAGVLLLLLSQVLNLRSFELAFAFLPFGVVWWVASFLLFRRYPVAIKNALAKRELADVSLTFDPSSVQLLRDALNSPYPEAVVYAASLLEQIDDNAFAKSLPQLLRSAAPDVQRFALERILRRDLRDCLPDVRQVLAGNPAPAVQEIALRTLAVLEDEHEVEEISHLLDAPNPIIRRGAMIGLLQSGGLDGILAAGQTLQRLIASPHAADRLLAAQVMGGVGLRNFYQPLIPLLGDSDMRVRQAALLAAGNIQHPRLWPLVVNAIRVSETSAAAIIALSHGKETVLNEVMAAFALPNQPVQVLIRLIRVCARIKGAAVIAFLVNKIDHPDPDVRAAVYSALASCQYRTPDPAHFQQYIRAEVGLAAYLLNAHADLADEPAAKLLREALVQQLPSIKDRILLLMGFAYDTQAIMRAREALQRGDSAQKAYALEVVDTALSQEMKGLVIPVIREGDLSERLSALRAAFPRQRQPLEERVIALIDGPTRWIRACALFTAGELRLWAARDRIEAAGQTAEPLLQDSARYARHTTDPKRSLLQTKEDSMLSTIEKVIILKTVNIFSTTPDDVLVEVASLLEEVRLKAGERLFEKGDLGTAMYMVVTGKVRVHNGDQVLDHRISREVFGELALLDPEPRIASVTAEEDTFLFRLDQEPFYELMADQIEVMRGIMRVVTGTLRARLRDLNETRQQLAAVTGKAPTQPSLPILKADHADSALELAAAYAKNRLRRELPPHLHYHNLGHTEDEVVPTVERLASAEGVTGHSLILLRTAAWFHDLGFIKQGPGHEEVSVQYAREALPIMGYTAQDIDVIAGIIMATRLPQSPRTLLEQIIADADLDLLGSANFIERNRELRQELAAGGKTYTDVEWYTNQLAFIRGHTYFTKSATQLNAAQKERNIAAMSELLARASTA